MTWLSLNWRYVAFGVFLCVCAVCLYAGRP